MPIPRLNRNAIELKAEELLEWFNPNKLTTPSLIPVAEIAQTLSDKYEVQLHFDIDLGKSARGKKILGACQFKSRIIYIDPSLVQNNNPRFVFTLAHEIGHLILHRKLSLEDIDLDSSSTIHDSRLDIFLGRKQIQTPRQWLEWQANTFAACLILPRKTLHIAITEIQTQLGVTRKLGTIYLDNQPINRYNYIKIIEHLIFVFQSSKTVIHIRLLQLGLLEDYRNYSVRHISTLFKEE